MDNCALPATGGSTTGLIVIAALAIVAGVLATRLARHRAVPVVVMLCVAVGVVGWAGPARAAADCPAPTSPATTSPATTSPATTSPATTSTTTTSLAATTTTVPPGPQNDFYTVVVGASGSGNILANDSLGTPPGVLADLFDLDTPAFAADGSMFDVLDGLIPVAYATASVTSDGSIVFTGVTEGRGVFGYNLGTGPGQPAGPPAAVYIDVVAAPATTTVPTTTSSTTTSTTTPLIAPIANNDELFITVGEPYSFDYFANDEMFGLPVTSGAFANLSGCAVNSADVNGGVMSGTGGTTVGDCVAQYSFTTAGGTSNGATITIHTSAAPT